MDAHRFDRITKTLAASPSRRGMLRGLAGLVLGSALVAAPLGRLRPASVGATHTPGGCGHNGERCTAGTQCCSGRCVRKRDTNKKFCRPSPNQGTCTIEQAFCFDTSRKFPPCGSSNSLSCNCYVTTAGHSVCGAARDCFACKTDADCVNRRNGGKRGDRCVQCTTDPASDLCPGTGGRVCVHKCADLFTD